MDYQFGADPGEDIASGFGLTASTIGKGYKSLYDLLPGSLRAKTTPAMQGTYNAVEPLVSKLFNQYLEEPLRTGTKVATNLIQNKPWDEQVIPVSKIPNSSSWHDVVNAAREKLPTANWLPDKVKDIAANDLGMALNLGADPAMYAGLAGETAKGVKALKAGEEAASLTKGLQTGERSLAHIGALHTPGFINKPVGQAMEKTGQAINKIPGFAKIAAGFKTSTNMPDLNNKQQKFKADMNAAHLDATQFEKDDAKVIEKSAKEAGVTPDAMHKQMLEYIEPAESQAVLPDHLSEEAFQKQIDKVKGIEDKIKSTPKLAIRKKLDAALNIEGNNLEMMNHEKQGIEDNLRQTQEKLGNELHPAVKALADKHIEDYRKFNESEGGKSRSFYVEHNATPEWQDFKAKFLPELETPKGQKIDNVQKAIHDAINARSGAFKNMTINEVNNLSEAGKLRQIPALKDMKVLDNFKGKVFDDNAARIHAQRFLENKTVTTAKDYEEGLQRTYGIPFSSYDSKLAKGEVKPGDYIKDPKTDTWYPKEVANSIQKMRAIKTDTAFWRTVGNGWNSFNDLTKKLYFGAFPASVSKIYLGNQVLAYMNGLWHPISQAKGLKLAVGMRWDSIYPKAQEALKLAGFGPLSAEDQKLLQVMKENRMYGMGMARYESPQLEKSKGFFKTMWNAHNLAEDATRMGTGIEAMRQGYTPFAAGKATRKAVYDYSDLSEVDQAGKKLAPFYTFQRKNAENMAKLWLKNPGKLALPLKLQNEGDQDFQNQRQNWSANKAEGTSIPIGQILNNSLGTNLNDNLQLGLNSMWPANDINRWTGTGKTMGETASPFNVARSGMKTAASMVNPLVRAPLETMAGPLGYNLNAGTPIQKMEGQRGNLGPLEVPKKVEYLGKNLRILNDPLLPFTDAKDEPWQIATRLGTGLSFHNANPAQEKNYADMENKLNLKGSHEQGMKDLPRYFAKEALFKKQAGDMVGAKVANDNSQIAIQNLFKSLGQNQRQTKDSMDRAKATYKRLHDEGWGL